MQINSFDVCYYNKTYLKYLFLAIFTELVYKLDIFGLYFTDGRDHKFS